MAARKKAVPPAVPAIAKKDPPMYTCDTCNAPGKVTVVSAVGGGTLLLCGHHYRDNEVALLLAGWRIEEDQRDSPGS